MSKPAAKPRKRPARPAKKPAAKRSRTPKPPMTEKRSYRTPGWLPSPDHPNPVGRAIYKGVTAFRGSKRHLAAFLQIHRPNLSQFIADCYALEEGKIKEMPQWPPKHLLKLGSVSGVPLHELGPGIYLPGMKAPQTKIKPGPDPDTFIINGIPHKLVGNRLEPV